MTVNSVITIHCQCESMEDIKQWLIYILPNAKNLVLSYSPESTAHLYDRMIFLKKLDEYTLAEWIIDL
jgi:hypothetical protein